MIIELDLKGAKELERALREGFPKAVKFAVQDALTSAAFETRKLWQQEIEADFTLRNRFTTRSVQVVKATFATRQSIVGSTAGYMALQETGGTISGKSGAKPIPAPSAAGQPPGSTHRTRPVRKAATLRAVQLASKTRGKTNSQTNAIRAAMARRAGKRFVLLERPGGGQGIFRLPGGKGKGRARMLWGFSGSVTIAPTPTLARALARVTPKLPSIAERALLRQLKRHGVIR